MSEYPQDHSFYWTGASSATEERPQVPLGTARQVITSGWETGYQMPVQDWTQGANALAPEWTSPELPDPQLSTASQPAASPIDVPRSRFAAPPQASDYNPIWATGMFDDREAPELREARSENLENRESDFWKDPERRTAAQQRAKHQKAAQRRGVTALIILLAVLALGAFFLLSAFQVRTIRVEGNVDISDAEIIQRAGIALGQSTFSLDERSVSARIEADRYLSFVCMEVTWPDQVVLKVRERQPAAYVRYNGILFTLDNRGMVLEESLNTEMDNTALMNVGGLQPKRCEVGRELISADGERMAIFRELLVEARVLSCTADIRELNLSDKENLSLVTATGFSVRLGDADRLHAKLRSMLLTEAELIGRGYSSGSIDVSSPEKPTYIP